MSEAEAIPLVRARLPGPQLAALLGGIAASVTAATAIHASVFMPQILAQTSEQVEAGITNHERYPHAGAVSEQYLQMATEPLKVEMRNLTAAVERLTVKIDGMESKR